MKIFFFLFCDKKKMFHWDISALFLFMLTHNAHVLVCTYAPVFGVSVSSIRTYVYVYICMYAWKVIIHIHTYVLQRWARFCYCCCNTCVSYLCVTHTHTTRRWFYRLFSSELHSTTYICTYVILHWNIKIHLFFIFIAKFKKK